MDAVIEKDSRLCKENGTEATDQREGDVIQKVEGISCTGDLEKDSELRSDLENQQSGFRVSFHPADSHRLSPGGVSSPARVEEDAFCEMSPAEDREVTEQKSVERENGSHESPKDVMSTPSCKRTITDEDLVSFVLLKHYKFVYILVGTSDKPSSLQKIELTGKNVPSLSYVSRRDKMRRFVEISHNELLISVERYGNVVYCGDKVFIYLNRDTAL